MTIFDWLEAVTDQMFSILLDSIWNSMLMGGTTVLVAGVALLFNHYDWKRARILSTMTLIGLIGMHTLARVIFGSEVNSGMGLKSTAMTFLMGIFLIFGYYLAGWISSLRPNPVIKLKMNTAKRLILIAGFLETSAMDSTPVKKVGKEVEALAYVTNVINTKTAEASGSALSSPESS
jgi:hypothetical protein